MDRAGRMAEIGAHMDAPEDEVVDDTEMEDLEAAILDELEAAIEDAAADPLRKLSEIQPPTTIVRAAAAAAAQVLIAFERGYRMSGEPE